MITSTRETRADKADVEVTFDSIASFSPSITDLRVVTSSYLSHYETVPNPAKASLKTQLEIQRISVDSARSSYNFAVSMFNISPTEYTLASMNGARTRFNLEVNYFNSIVDLYNATPATTSRPVYLPYSFREGNIRHGWRLAGTISIGDRSEKFVSEE